MTTIALPEIPTGLTTLSGYVYGVGIHGAIMVVNPKGGPSRVIARVPGAQSIASGGGYLWAWPFHGGLARLYPVQLNGAVDAPLPPPISVEIKRLPFHGINDVASGTGSVWALLGRKLIRIHPATGRLGGAPILLPWSTQLNPSPHLAVAAGSVWVSGGGTGTVLRVRPTSKRSVLTTVRITPPATPTQGGPGNFAGTNLSELAAEGSALWICCDGRDGIHEIDAHTGRVMPGTVTAPACLGGTWDQIVASHGLWTYAGYAECGTGEPGEVFRVGPAPGLPYVGGRIDLRGARLYGPAETGADQGTMTVAFGRVWVTDSTPPSIISIPQTVSLPVWTYQGKAPTPWWVRWGWVLVGLTALILLGGALARLVRRRELTAR